MMFFRGLVYADATGDWWFLKDASPEPEVAAARIGRAIGLNVVPARVYAPGTGQMTRRTGALLPVIKGAIDMDEHPRYARQWPVSWTQQVFLDELLSYLIGDYDRHGGNFLVAPSMKLYSIDHLYSLTVNDLTGGTSVSRHISEAGDNSPIRRLNRRPDSTLAHIRPGFVSKTLGLLAEVDIEKIVRRRVLGYVAGRRDLAGGGMVDFFTEIIGKAKRAIPEEWQRWQQNPVW